jgi:Calcineurin-like phosphoesterase
MILDNRNLITIILLAGIVGLGIQSVHATELDLLGDIGTNAVAKRNLAILAKGNECLVGLGDYSYTKTVSSTQQKAWDGVECKIGVPGNHEEEKGESPAWAQKNFKYQTYSAWRFKDVLILGLDPYSDFEKGSKQYNFIVEKYNQYKDRPGINWIIVASHPPMFTPTVEGGHGPDTALRDTYLPIFKGDDKVILAGAHNHVTAFGSVQGYNVVVCGGGGKGGDSVGGEGKNSGFEFVTSEDFGHCDFQLDKNSATVLLVGDDGKEKGMHRFVKDGIPTAQAEAAIHTVPQAQADAEG